jgi:hypothetical protein
MGIPRDDSSRPSHQIARFFSDLEAWHHEPLLGHQARTLRIDVSGGDGVEHWYVRVKKGAIEVSHDDADADVVFALDAGLMAAIAGWG